LADINQNTNIEVRPEVPTLSFRGKVWRINLGGVETIAMNKDGDPVQSVPMIVLDYNKARSRALYPAYVEGQSKPPICWSNDGVTPDNSVQTKQSDACASCPQSQKGSKVTEQNAMGVACAQFKRAVVVPANQPDFEPLLLKIPQTSMYDKDNKENEAKSFYAFDQYMEMLKSKGVNHTASVITKIKFDARTAYPKLLFSAHGWTPVESSAAVKAQLAKKEKIDALLQIVDVSTPSPEAPAPDEFEQAAAAPAAPAPAPAPAPVAAKPAAPAPAATKPRPAAKPAAAPAPAPAPAPAAPAGDPDDDMAAFIPAGQAAPAVAAATVVNPAPAAAPAAPAADTTPAAVGNPLAALVAGWDTE